MLKKAVPHQWHRNKGSVAVQMSMEMMKGMSAEDMANMQRMAGQMQGGSGGAPGAAPKMDMSSMMKDPKAMESAMKMMTGMDEGALANMLKMSQPGMSDDAARKAAQQMKSMDEGSMKMMMKVAGGVQGAYVKYKSAQAWLLARPGVLAAIAFLLIALLARWFGLM